MMRTKVLDAAQLTDAFRRSKVGDKFLAGNENEQKRAFNCAACAGRQIATRKIKAGWKVTVIE